MQDRIENRGIFPPDTSGGQETRITPITLRDLAMQIYKERVEIPEKPRDMGYFFAATTEVENGPVFPTVGIYFDPSWVDRNRTRINLLKVNSIGSVRIGQHSLQAGRLPAGVYGFRVYDFPVAKVDDPTFVDDIKEIRAEEISVPANIDDATLVDSWVADPGVRDRINDWFVVSYNVDKEDPGDFLRKRDDVEKYVMLRQSPFNTHTVPGYGKYTYEGVVEDATRQFKSEWDFHINKMVDKPITFRMFTLDDVEWLETFMSNKGIAIPNKS